VALSLRQLSNATTKTTMHIKTIKNCKVWHSFHDGRKTHAVLEWNRRRRQLRSRSSSGNVPVSIRGSVSRSPMIHRPSDVDGSQQLYAPQQHLYAPQKNSMHTTVMFLEAYNSV